MTDFLELERAHTLHVYPKRERVIVRGEGATLWDDQGQAYIDCMSGHGVAAVGHGNPRVAEAVAHQARTLVSCPGVFFNDRRALLLKKLVNLAPTGLNRAFLCN
jgi:acetylornithine/LysW-gamma-L-lysine aminotransferase